MESGFFLSARTSFHSELAEAMVLLDSAAVSPTSTDKFENFEENFISL